jgi:DNA-binding MarR family transcriptional regulator
MLTALDYHLAANQHGTDLGVTGAQFIVLARVAASQGKKSASELCKEMSYDAGAMTRMIDRIESKGLIRRVRCMQDRRLVYLELTDLGRTAYPRIREISMAN